MLTKVDDEENIIWHFLIFRNPRKIFSHPSCYACILSTFQNFHVIFSTTQLLIYTKFSFFLLVHSTFTVVVVHCTAQLFLSIPRSPSNEMEWGVWWDVFLLATTATCEMCLYSLNREKCFFVSGSGMENVKFIQSFFCPLSHHIFKPIVRVWVLERPPLNKYCPKTAFVRKICCHPCCVFFFEKKKLFFLH